MRTGSVYLDQDESDFTKSTEKPGSHNYTDDTRDGITPVDQIRIFHLIGQEPYSGSD